MVLCEDRRMRRREDFWAGNGVVAGCEIAEEDREKGKCGSAHHQVAPGPVFTIIYPCNRQT